jgi:integrase
MALYELKTGEAVQWRQVIENHLSDYRPLSRKKWWWGIAEIEEITGRPLIETTSIDAESYKAAQTRRTGYKDRRTGESGRLDPSTISTKIHTLHAVFECLRGHGLITHNPFDPVVQSKAVRSAVAGQKRPARLIAPDDVRKLLYFSWRETKWDIRDCACLNILLGSGLRSAGLRGLRLCDVLLGDNNSMCLWVVENKGNAPYKAPVPKWARNRIYQLVAQRRQEGAKPSDPLMCNYDAAGKPSNTFTCHATFKKRWEVWLKDAGIYEAWTPHCARATAVTHALDHGMNQRQAMEAFGWKSSRMVEIYNKHRVEAESSPLNDVPPY